MMIAIKASVTLYLLLRYLSQAEQLTPMVPCKRCFTLRKDICDEQSGHGTFVQGIGLYLAALSKENARIKRL